MCERWSYLSPSIAIERSSLSKHWKSITQSGRRRANVLAWQRSTDMSWRMWQTFIMHADSRINRGAMRSVGVGTRGEGIVKFVGVRFYNKFLELRVSAEFGILDKRLPFLKDRFIYFFFFFLLFGYIRMKFKSTSNMHFQFLFLLSFHHFYDWIERNHWIINFNNFHV